MLLEVGGDPLKHRIYYISATSHTDAHNNFIRSFLNLHFSVEHADLAGAYSYHALPSVIPVLAVVSCTQIPTF
jgi:hypothetical protein